ncbi:MAG: preprotein translocase subunit SecG [Christensenellaceae bacterium]|jgi:preprotein translocase subunit SecG|nr:preprotein translocase subunit SecG [Christensenellaceae bacterium]
MNVALIVVGIVLALDSLALTILVLMQQGRAAGLSGAIAGGAETFFGKKKAQSYEGKLLFFTKITACGFVVLAIAMLVLQKFA